ncbi:MAG: alanine--tRNA ligase [Pseudomonadota bacterium]
MSSKAMVSSNEIRSTFLEFFRDKRHQIVASSPLVPANDRTLLFTNAGMVQFKDVFLGTDPRNYNRATTSQRCVRAGGKHNDLENVGYTARHHTFFEMLGNFSFGDYFKRDAIRFAWELLTEHFGLPPEKLWVTVYEEDEEAENIWFNEIGIDQTRFSRCGAKDNFWSMGDTGPCGPCSEIFYDHGPEIPGGPPGSPDEDGDRYIEIWNLVFMQFDRSEDGTMTPLPKPSVDTGMGLERLAAVLQGVHSNYETDLFVALIDAAAKATGTADMNAQSLRVIADHIRSCAFLVVDGVRPSNEDRGYVLRRIIRRAVRHGHKLGMQEPFFYTLVDSLCEQMGDAFPELPANADICKRVLRHEEDRFAETLDQGMRILERAFADLDGNVLPGATIFELYDTYGFPPDLTADIARERNVSADLDGFEQAMERQREKGRADRKAKSGGADLVIDAQTTFTGYGATTGNGAVVALFAENDAVASLEAGMEGILVLDSTPFYAEAGGQVGDVGELRGEGFVFEVRDTQKNGRASAHIGVVRSGSVSVGTAVQAEVDAFRRVAIARNHSATHLLHAALRNVLGEHVQQKGSLVAPDRLRFDFSHFEPVSVDEMREIERQVNAGVMHNIEVTTRLMALDDAIASGAMALFGEKYDDTVRVLGMGDVSVELCGGTHVGYTGEVGLFKVVSETGVAAGVRRIEAVSGDGALGWAERTNDLLDRVAATLKTDTDALEQRVESLIQQNRELERELGKLRDRLASAQGNDILDGAVEVGGIKVLAARLDGVDARSLANSLDQLKQRVGSGVIVIGAVDGEKVNLIAGVTSDLIDRVQAGPLVNHVARQVGGKGGGRPDMARAGGRDPANLDNALASVPAFVESL